MIAGIEDWKLEMLSSTQSMDDDNTVADHTPVQAIRKIHKVVKF